MANQCMLTTFDNPFDPFEQFPSWYRFDEDKGYHSCAYLARIARTSDQLSDQENDEEIERAIDEIIKYDFMSIYKKVKLNQESNQLQQDKVDTNESSLAEAFES